MTGTGSSRVALIKESFKMDITIEIEKGVFIYVSMIETLTVHWKEEY
jgi:hypothetical protein